MFITSISCSRIYQAHNYPLGLKYPTFQCHLHEYMPKFLFYSQPSSFHLSQTCCLTSLCFKSPSFLLYGFDQTIPIIWTGKMGRRKKGEKQKTSSGEKGKMEEKKEKREYLILPSIHFMVLLPIVRSHWTHLQ